MRKLNIITIERRPDDYIVYMNGNKTIWECNRGPDKASIALIKTLGPKNVFPIGPYKYINPRGINYPIDIYPDCNQESCKYLEIVTEVRRVQRRSLCVIRCKACDKRLHWELPN